MTFLPSKDSVLSAAEDMGAVALEAIRQRDAAVKRVAELEEELTDTRMRAGQLGDEVTALHGRFCDLEAQNEDLRGRANGVDVGTLRGAIRALLKSGMSSGDLRRALGELVR